jgi:hypothetical protein
LYEYLAPKRCLYEYKFNKEKFDRVIEEIIDSFNKSTVQPGEMVGIVGAQSQGEPLTKLYCQKAFKLQDRVGRYICNRVNKYIINA